MHIIYCIPYDRGQPSGKVKRDGTNPLLDAFCEGLLECKQPLRVLEGEEGIFWFSAEVPAKDMEELEALLDDETQAKIVYPNPLTGKWKKD